MKLTVPHILALFLMSLFVGVIIISIGVGTDLTGLNTVMAPLVCLEREMSYTQHVFEIGNDTYFSACLNRQ